MIEVEVKAHVGDFEEIRKKLNLLGAKRMEIQGQEDTYFHAPHRDFAKTDEALRLRQTTTKKKSKIYMTYKGSKLDDLSKTRVEIEVGVDDYLKMYSILENLNFKALPQVIKEREIYQLNEYIISLDTVHNLGKFLEIEKNIGEQESYKEVRDEIFHLYEKIGIVDGFERLSYLELLGL